MSQFLRLVTALLEDEYSSFILVQGYFFEKN